MVEYDMKTSNGTLTGSWEVERAFCDVDDACEKITILYNNPILREQMGKNGRKAVEEKYDFEIVGKQFEDLFIKITK